jgi:hypothetical protein
MTAAQRGRFLVGVLVHGNIALPTVGITPSVDLRYALLRLALRGPSCSTFHWRSIDARKRAGYRCVLRGGRSCARADRRNSDAPGPKVCYDVSVSAGRSVQLLLTTQCALTGSGGHFGLIVVADKAAPQANAFYGYMRVQNPQGIGFSVEGFPVTNFNNQVGHATRLKRKAAAPTYQTNCFVGSLDQPVSYQVKLSNDGTGAQVGGTLSGSLTAFQQFRYLDVFGPNGVNAPAGDLANVRAEFTQTSGGSANLIGFCTVQDNTSFGADFRIAKSYGWPSSSFFAQGGNAFGATAHLGTNDNQPLELYANGQRIARYEPNVLSPNVINGHSSNSTGAFIGQTLAGGGLAGTNCYDLTSGTFTRNCFNTVNGHFSAISGGSSTLSRAGVTQMEAERQTP